MKYAIAIDGPSGAGKSTIARLCAKELNYIYIDTGAMYRAATLYFIGNNIEVSDEEVVLHNIDNIDIRLTFVDGEQHVMLCGKDVSQQIRTQAVADKTSKVSTIGAVREKLVDLQRNIAALANVVMDGRDIGTVVLPNAFLKIYLDASPTVRGMRRLGELQAKGVETDFNTVLLEVLERDERDMNRGNSPLKKADDAVFIDSSNMSAAEVVEKIVSLAIKNRESQGD